MTINIAIAIAGDQEIACAGVKQPSDADLHRT